MRIAEPVHFWVSLPYYRCLSSCGLARIGSYLVWYWNSINRLEPENYEVWVNHSPSFHIPVRTLWKHSNRLISIFPLDKRRFKLFSGSLIQLGLLCEADRQQRDLDCGNPVWKLRTLNAKPNFGISRWVALCKVQRSNAMTNGCWAKKSVVHIW